MLETCAVGASQPWVGVQPCQAAAASLVCWTQKHRGCRAFHFVEVPVFVGSTTSSGRSAADCVCVWEIVGPFGVKARLQVVCCLPFWPHCPTGVPCHCSRDFTAQPGQQGTTHNVWVLLGFGRDGPGVYHNVTASQARKCHWYGATRVGFWMPGSVHV